MTVVVWYTWKEISIDFLSLSIFSYIMICTLFFFSNHFILKYIAAFGAVD